MQRGISNKNTLGEALNPYDDAPKSTAIDRTASNYTMQMEKFKNLETSLIWENTTQIYQNTYPVSLN